MCTHMGDFPKFSHIYYISFEFENQSHYSDIQSQRVNSIKTSQLSAKAKMAKINSETIIGGVYLLL